MGDMKMYRITETREDGAYSQTDVSTIDDAESLILQLVGSAKRRQEKTTLTFEPLGH